MPQRKMNYDEWFAAAGVRYRRGEIDAAYETFRKLAQAEPSRVEPWECLADLAESRHDHPMARQCRRVANGLHGHGGTLKALLEWHEREYPKTWRKACQSNLVRGLDWLWNGSDSDDHPTKRSWLGRLWWGDDREKPLSPLPFRTVDLRPPLDFEGEVREELIKFGPWLTRTEAKWRVEERHERTGELGPLKYWVLFTLIFGGLGLVGVAIDAVFHPSREDVLGFFVKLIVGILGFLINLVLNIIYTILRIFIH